MSQEREYEDSVALSENTGKKKAGRGEIAENSARFPAGLLFFHAGQTAPLEKRILHLLGQLLSLIHIYSARMAYETAQIPETKLLYRSYDEGNALYLVDVKTGDIREGSFSADDELYQIKDVSRDCLLYTSRCV